MHTGSDILDVEVFYMQPKFYSKRLKISPELDFIDFGSGFKVPYKKEILKLM